MITGFEEQTKPLTDKERDVFLPLIIEGIQVRRGKENAISNKEIVSRLRERRGVKMSEARVRKIVNHIRCYDLVPCLIATSDGYYIAESEQELLDYEESLEGREDAIREVRRSIRRQRILKYHKNGELDLWQN